MNIKLHAAKKEIREDGTTTVYFVPILADAAEGSILSGGNLGLTVPTASDTFVIGEDYDGSFSEILQ